ncbi:plasma membrane-associated cation-binding protein 1 [Magnolia sinica]|uniref:plasma membrane-associated cation-binding protein 1 n=1 Tax=Magnolia sinica TaxID=86752 RepID=UPI00265A92D3|nr:plasma membrane-associated cation-binding protein 1 [Magnolia sinica]XP_058095391.1 plasma membrane-associated cation-binding protein 1 [Magnolia sinica]
MGYWKSKVLPKIKKVFEKNGGKKAAAEACKTFDDSKEAIDKEFEEKKTDLQPKVIEIYEASSTNIKTVVKERKDAEIKKNSSEVQKFIEELVKIDFPGSKPVSEACTKFGPALVPGPVFFIFEKVSTFIVTEEKEAPPTTTTEGTVAVATEETIKEKEKEIVIEEEKKEEEKTLVEEVAEKKSEPTPSEKAKVEEEAPKP